MEDENFSGSHTALLVPTFLERNLFPVLFFLFALLSWPFSAGSARDEDVGERVINAHLAFLFVTGENETSINYRRVRCLYREQYRTAATIAEPFAMQATRRGSLVYIYSVCVDEHVDRAQPRLGVCLPLHAHKLCFLPQRVFPLTQRCVRTHATHAHTHTHLHEKEDKDVTDQVTSAAAFHAGEAAHECRRKLCVIASTGFAAPYFFFLSCFL